MKHFIFVADDFGLSKEINEGIRYTHRAGAVALASLMVREDASSQAVKIARECPGLVVGLHLRVDQLLDVDPGFWAGERHEGFCEKIDDARLRDAIRAECEAQVREFLSLGFAPTFLNSHYHVHTVPSLFPIFVDVARAHGFRFMRLSVHTPLLLHPDIPITQHVLSGMSLTLTGAGIAHTDWFEPTFFYLLPPKLSDGVTELMFHPAVGDSEAGYLDLARLLVWGDMLRADGCSEVFP